MHGFGTFCWPDKRVYNGFYAHDLKEGWGTFDWPDGRTFEGQWSKGKMNGIGKLTPKRAS